MYPIGTSSFRLTMQHSDLPPSLGLLKRPFWRWHLWAGDTDEWIEKASLWDERASCALVAFRNHS